MSHLRRDLLLFELVFRDDLDRLTVIIGRVVDDGLDAVLDKLFTFGNSA